MKLLKYGKDGGPDSTVSGFWIVELKSLFSIVILKFNEGSREVFHSHSFNAFTWFLKGKVEEELLNGTKTIWKPSFKPKRTPRSCFHKVFAIKTTYAISFRGPWSEYWNEYDPKTKKLSVLTNGRKVIHSSK